MLAAPSCTGRPPAPISVSVQPGQIAFTRMPSARTSPASVRVSAFNAALLTWYAGGPAPMEASDPASLETFTIRACGLRRSSGKNARQVRHAPNRVRFHAAVDAIQVRRAGARVRVIVDGGVVDQHIAASEVFGHVLRRGLHACGIVDVKLQGVDTFEAKLAHRCLAAARVARAHRHHVTVVRQLAAELEPDAAIAAGYYGDRRSTRGGHLLAAPCDCDFTMQPTAWLSARSAPRIQAV